MSQNNIEIDKLLLETGSKIYIDEIKTYIVQPTIRDISEVMQGEKQFLTCITYICKTIINIDELKQNKDITEEDIQIFSKISSFEYLLGLMSKQPYIFIYFIQLLKLFFPNYIWELENDNNNVYINMTDINKVNKDTEEENKDKGFQINKENYDLIIKYIEKIINLNFDKKEDDYNPINEQARKIAEKLKESHKKLQEIKNKNGEDYFYAKVINLLRGTGYFDMKELLDMTIYQLVQTYQRFSLYDGRQIQTIYHAAGAEIKDFIDWTQEIK